MLFSAPIRYALIVVATFLGIWGYCFELAYFSRLGVNVHETLDLYHYVVSGAVSIVPMLIVLFIFANVLRFFSKDVHSNPIEEVATLVEKSTFKNQIGFARLGAIVAFVFLVLVVTLPAIGIKTQIWYMYSYMIFLVLQSFFGAMITSPVYARSPLILAFLLAVAACFAAGGYGYAASKPDGGAGGLLRDDMIATVKVNPGGELVVTPRKLTIPVLSFLKSLWQDKSH